MRFCTISIAKSLFVRRRRACYRAMRFAIVRVSERLGLALHALVPGACADLSANSTRNCQNQITVDTLGNNSILTDCARTRFDRSLYRSFHEPRPLKFSFLVATARTQDRKTSRVQAVQNAIKIAILGNEDVGKPTLPLSLRNAVALQDLNPQITFVRRSRACCRAMRFAIVRVSERLGFALHALVSGACADRSANSAKNLQNHITVETLGRANILPDCARTRVDRSLYKSVHKPRVLKFSLLPAPLHRQKKTAGRVQAVQSAIDNSNPGNDYFDKPAMPL